MLQGVGVPFRSPFWPNGGIEVWCSHWKYTFGFPVDGSEVVEVCQKGVSRSLLHFSHPPLKHEISCFSGILGMLQGMLQGEND